MSEQTASERFAGVWSPEARADLRAIERETAMQVLYCIADYVSKRVGGVKKVKPAPHRLPPPLPAIIGSFSITRAKTSSASLALETARMLTGKILWTSFRVRAMNGAWCCQSRCIHKLLRVLRQREVTYPGQRHVCSRRNRLSHSDCEQLRFEARVGSAGLPA